MGQMGVFDGVMKYNREEGGLGSGYTSYHIRNPKMS